MDFPGVTGESYVLASVKADCERSVNVWRELIESGEGDGQYWLRKSPGRSVFISDLPEAGHRGAFELNGHTFMVVGNTLYDYIGANQSGSYGPIAGTGPVYMAASPTALMIVADGHLYRLSGTLTEIVLTFTPIGVAFLKNYFIVLPESALQQFQWSDDDGVTFPAANVQTAEADANRLTAIAVIHQQLFLIGNRITQAFYVGDNPNAPFIPIDSAVIRSGTKAPASVKALGDALYWLDNTQDGRGDVVRLEGYSIRKMSNAYIGNMLEGFTGGTDDAIGQAFKLAGHEFYRLTFPIADKTIEYHLQQREGSTLISEWEEISDWNFHTQESHRHRAAWIVATADGILCGDHTNGFVYKFSFATYHDAGFPIRWNRRTPHITEGGKSVSHYGLELGMETGVGLVTPLWLNNYSLQATDFATALAAAVSGATVTADQAIVLQRIYDVLPYTPLDPYPDSTTMTSLGFYAWGTDPDIFMSYSNDGGANFGAESSRKMGRSAMTETRVYWNRLGASMNRVYDFYGTDPVKLAISSAELTAAAGRS